ncbi:MAG: hypothetical protein AAFR61_14635 [Bacteroidota bacterium]
MKKFWILTAALSFLFSFSAMAQSTPVVKRSQIKQQKRIYQGVAQGELTKKETIRLQKQQRNIQRTKRVAKRDGVVTPKEKAVIRHKQARASRNIYRQKHDGQKR